MAQFVEFNILTAAQANDAAGWSSVEFRFARLKMNYYNKNWPLTLLFLCGFFLLTSNASAVERVLDVGKSNRNVVSLTEYFSVLEDSSRSLTLIDVQKPAMASRFSGGQAPAEALSYGFTRSAYWLRLHLKNSADHPVERMLEIGYPTLSSIQFYNPIADGAYQTLATGVATPFSTRPYPNRFFVFSLTLLPHADQVFYLRFQSASSMLIPARLWEPQAFHAYERDDYAVQAWYFGMAAAIILFNVLLFIELRDAVYLLYVVFALCVVLTISAQNGWGKEFIWPETTQWANIAISVGYSIMLAALLFFMRCMLDTRATVPKLDWLIRLFIGILLLLPIGFAVSLQAFALPSTLFFSATGVLILFVGIFCAFFMRQRIALFFLAAYSMFLSGAFVGALKTLRLLPDNILTMNGLQIGSALEMLLLAFALAYRFNMIRSQATMDVKRANASLEQRLLAREVELKKSHQIMRDIERHQTLGRERQRLMQDMHDGLGSSLISALRVVECGKLDANEIIQVLKGCIEDLKLSIDSMELDEADLLLLLATLRYRLEPRLKSADIALRWEVEDVPKLDWLDPGNALHVLRILQESFTNIIKHTHATEIRVATHVEENHVLVSITDNGQGFIAEDTLKKGCKGMSNQMRRAQAISAEISWDTSSIGTCTILRLPITQHQTVCEAHEKILLQGSSGVS